MKQNSNIEEKLKKQIQMQYIIIFLLIVNIFITILLNGKVEEQKVYNDAFDVSSFTQVSLSEIEKYVNTTDYKVLLIGKPNCEYTNKMLPILKQAQEKYGYETLYVDQRTITQSDQEKFFKYDDETNFLQEYLGTTPFIIVFKENRMVDTWVGYQDFSVFESFLTGLGIEE